MGRSELINIILFLGIFIAFVCIILPWATFEPLIEDPSLDDWRQFSAIGVLLSGEIIPLVGVVLFIIGTIVTIWYPVGSIVQLAGLLVFGLTAIDLVAGESIAYEMKYGIGYIGGWGATLMITGSSLPYLRGFTIDQGRGVEPVAKFTERLSGDVFRILMMGGMRRRK